MKPLTLKIASTEIDPQMIVESLYLLEELNKTHTLEIHLTTKFNGKNLIEATITDPTSIVYTLLSRLSKDMLTIDQQQDVHDVIFTKQSDRPKQKALNKLPVKVRYAAGALYHYIQRSSDD